MRITRRSTLAALATLPVNGAARADAWPTKPLTIVVPYAAGSATDTFSRLMAEKLAPRLGQPVIVDNRGGGNGSIAGGIVAHANPDGYTLMMATAATHAGNPNLIKAIPYDSLADFTPAGFCGSIPFTLVMGSEAGVGNIAEFIKKAKGARPPLSYGAGTASARVIASTLAQRSGIELLHVPYKSAPQAMADVLSGHIDATFPDVGIATPQVTAGKLRALIIASLKRSPLLPDVPTFEEAGLGAFALDAWFVLAVPAKTPLEIVEKIDRAVAAVVAEPDAIARMRAIAIEPKSLSRSETRAFMRAEKDKWAALVKAAGIEPE